MTKVKIACPKCDWEPSPSDLWTCNCGHAWHTFDTGGQCPACNKVHEHTQCMEVGAGGCAKMSPHLDWYRNLDDWLRKEIEKIQQQKPANI